ncbi:MAG: methyltransferase domain-containing protein [Bacteroidia bacterium]|nr:methyltransferase domain-containing protein [Bacteroidia bacterium]MCX7651717.1 methyltransferase domain-containing protein [Bacteroidia bacterium]MDW8417449.1 methyltransferase domain-containing protein [Bacteroidia bacterium]
MRRDVLHYAACPRCLSSLRIGSIEEEVGEHIMEGTLLCEGCQAKFPIRRGIPRLLPEALLDSDWHERTVKRFGIQWHIFNEADRKFYESQFISFIQPVQPEFFRGKVVLDVGCGKGRHVRLASLWGSRTVIGFDLSEAVEVSFQNTRDLPNVHILQGDIFHMPIKKGVVDYAYSVGVIHHTPDPELAFQKIVERVKPGGAISVWVYGKENNWWVTQIISPIRERYTSRMHWRALMVISWFLTLPLYALSKTIYKLRFLRKVLPYFDYIHHLKHFSFKEIWSIVYDHLTPSVAYYLSREEFESFWKRAGISPTLSWRNRNSWSGFGYVPSAEVEPLEKIGLETRSE